MNAGGFKATSSSAWTMLGTILGLILVTSGVTASTTYYRWVDQSGVTHYSDAVPPKDAQAQEITTLILHDSPAVDPAANADNVDQKVQSGQVDALAAARAGFCDNAQRRLNVLNSGEPTVEFDASGTQTHPLSAADAAARRKDLESKLRDFCTPPSAQVVPNKPTKNP
jgi:Domain of unknown function (DUF4124)